ncbi:MAG: tetratricopeptide repeat protein [Planctomycetota bacterium]|jgi:tetratricopeptide (TPR) repeat protein
MTDRIESIRALLAKDPEDVFLTYSLAMELAAAEQLDDALKTFARCVELDPSYLAGFVEAGKCARAAGHLDEAKKHFDRALELAKSAGETHTVDAVRQQLETL